MVIQIILTLAMVGFLSIYYQIHETIHLNIPITIDHWCKKRDKLKSKNEKKMKKTDRLLAASIFP